MSDQEMAHQEIVSTKVCDIDILLFSFSSPESSLWLAIVIPTLPIIICCLSTTIALNNNAEIFFKIFNLINTVGFKLYCVLLSYQKCLVERSTLFIHISVLSMIFLVKQKRRET